MSSVAVFVGLDYHQNGVQVCVMDAEGNALLNRQVNNSTQSIRRVVGRLQHPVAAVAIEACCGAADLAEQLHRKVGWSVSLAHPGFVSRMKQNPDKTDYGDARLLADLLRVGYLPKVWLAPEEIRQLRRLVRYRVQLVDRRRNVKLRMRALLRENRLRCPLAAKAWTIPWLAWVAQTEELCPDDRWLMSQHLEELGHLNGRVQEAEGRLKERSAGDAVIQKLMSFRGIGLITAVTMRAEIGRFDRFQSGKQLARFCGLSPKNASSGERQAEKRGGRSGGESLYALALSPNAARATGRLNLSSGSTKGVPPLPPSPSPRP